MDRKQEIYQDIVCNCDVLLGVLKNYSAANDTPEGRMIYQCRWLKEKVAEGSLSLPVQDYVHTLKSVYTERYLEHLATIPERYQEEIEIFLYRLLNLTEGKLIIKPLYYPYVILCIDKFSKLLKTSQRKLDQYEQGLIGELTQLVQIITDGKTELPLMYYLPNYPNFRKVYSLAGSSTDDLPHGKILTKTVAHLVFEGIRPETWISPEAADRDTASL